MGAGGPVAVVTGVPRSGTSLVRNILAAHPSVVAPPEAQFIGVALGMLLERSHVGDLPTALSLLQHEPGFGRWELPAAALDDELHERPPRSFADLVGRLYDAYGAHHGGRPIDKTTGTGTWLPLARALFPDVPAVVVVRDPRAVAMSLSLQPWHTGGLAAAAHAWRRGVEADLAMVDDDPEHHHLVRFEDLLAAPEITIERLRGVVGLDAHPAMARWWEHGAAAEITTRRAARPLEPLPRDHGDLHRAELAVIEAAAGPLLERLGYERLVGGVAQLGRWFPARATLVGSAARARADAAVARRAPGALAGPPTMTGALAGALISPAVLIPVDGGA